MKKFDATFRDDLRKAVMDVESTSGVELVVTIIPRSLRKTWVNFALGSGLAFVVLTLLMFLPNEFWYVGIYIETLVAFGAGFALPFLFPGIYRLFYGAGKLKKESLKTTQSIFYQAGMTNTKLRIGVLICFYWEEREVVILADSGARDMVPPDEWNAIQARFQRVLDKPDIAAAILEETRALQKFFEIYIPRAANDVNELPDELWLHL